MGIDIGSISAKIAIIDERLNLLYSGYLYHLGNPVHVVAQLLREAYEAGYHHCFSICTTGSGRNYIGRALHAEYIKNEITALWKAMETGLPEAKTIIEIGGQDSKLIVLDQGEIVNFKLNSVCAAGTGAFIEQQSHRLGIPINKLSELALAAATPAKFIGRCTVFVETEIINLQQRGHSVESIAAGLFEAICENYLNDLSPGMRLEGPYVFCGGVSEIGAVRHSLERKFNEPVIIPSINKIAGAFGAALLAAGWHRKEEREKHGILDLAEGLLSKKVQPASPCKNTDCLNCGSSCYGI